MSIFTQRALWILLVIFAGICAGMGAGIAHHPLPSGEAEQDGGPQADTQPSDAASASAEPVSPTHDDPSGLKMRQLELPAVDPAELDLPNLSEPADRALRGRIRRMLDGKEPITKSGDAILDGMLEHLGERRSILEGSVLETADAAAGEPKSDAGANRAHAAELLLKTARKLEKIGSSRSGRHELVVAMRREAVKLLTE